MVESNSELTTPGRRHLISSRLGQWILAAGAIIVAVLAYGVVTYEPRVPVFDETLYLKHALSLHEYGIFSDNYRIGGPPPSPGAFVGPGYPAIASLFFFVDPSFKALAKCVVAQTSDCQPGLGLTYSLQLLFAAVAVFFVYAGGIVLFAHRGVAAMAALVFLVATDVPTYYANHALTEILVVPLSFAIGLALVHATRQKKPSWFFVVGLLLAITALVRPPYFHLGLFCLAAGAIWSIAILILRRDATWLKAMIAFGFAFVLISGPWVARNAVVLDTAKFNVGYGAFPLSSRLSYNRMTTREWSAAWIYWLPDFGDSLATDIFGEDTVRRLNISGRENFLSGPRSEIRASLRELPEDVDSVSWLIRNEILADPWKHMAVSLVMAWQGVFVAKYVGLVGLIALIWAVAGGTRGTLRRDILLLAAPPVLMLGLQANISVSIPRYNLPLLLPMILSAVYAAWKLVEFGRARIWNSPK